MEGTAPPALRTQKAYIKQHGALFDRSTKVQILQRVLNTVRSNRQAIVREVQVDGEPCVDLDLDQLGRLHPELLASIYGIALARVRALSVVCGAPGSAPAPGRIGGPFL